MADRASSGWKALVRIAGAPEPAVQAAAPSEASLEESITKY